MSIFDLHAQVLSDYRDFVRSFFIVTSGSSPPCRVKHAVSANRQWIQGRLGGVVSRISEGRSSRATRSTGSAGLTVWPVSSTLAEQTSQPCGGCLCQSSICGSPTSVLLRILLLPLTSR